MEKIFDTCSSVVLETFSLITYLKQTHSSQTNRFQNYLEERLE